MSAQEIVNWVTTADGCVHTADATQLDSFVASASAVCTGHYTTVFVVIVVQMMIGNAAYQCSCVRYVSQDNIALIVGLSVGIGLLLIIIIFVVVVIILRRKQTGPGKSGHTDDMATDKQYATRVDGDDDVENSTGVSANDANNNVATPTDRPTHYATHLDDDDIG